MDDAIHTHPARGCGSADCAVDVTVPAQDNFSATIFLFQCHISAAWYSNFRVTPTFNSFVIALSKGLLRRIYFLPPPSYFFSSFKLKKKFICSFQVM